MVGASGDSSVRCHLVWYDEKVEGLGGLVEGRLGGHIDGDNQRFNCGFDATYPGAFFYM